MAVIPDAIKGQISSYIRRAEELEKQSNNQVQVVAYCCRLYAVTKASKIPQTSSDHEINKFLISQMEKLEHMKPTINLGEDKGKLCCVTCANETFRQADEEDRNGMADKATAKLFYSASTFFDILELFGELDQETIEKRKYSKWKATDILNSIKEGRKPTPGGFGDVSMGTDGGVIDMPPPAPVGQSVSFVPSTGMTGMSNNNNSPSMTSMHPPMPSMQMVPNNANQHTMDQGDKPIPVSLMIPNRAPSVTEARIKDTVELCQFAISALKYNDIQMARERLTEALRRLN